MNNLKKPPVYIVAPLSSLSKRTRLFKLSLYLHNKGYDFITHFGWERIKGEAKETDILFDVKKNIILRGAGYGGLMVKVYYVFWMIKVFFKSFFIRRNSIVWALGFESAFPLLLGSKIIGYKVLFDDADRFSMLMSFPRPLNYIIRYLEKVTSRWSFLHIIPVQERYDFNSSKFYLLPNMPSFSEIEKAIKIQDRLVRPNSKLIININGWLGSGRGMGTALKIYNKLSSHDIHFVLVGRLDCSEAFELSNKDNVTYLGQVSNYEALSSYLISDFVLTYYDPALPINRYAASNKWGDALKLGTGIIVNIEVDTAQYLVDANVTLSFAYDDVDRLSDKLLWYLSDTSRIENIKIKSSKLGDSFGYFEDQLDALINKL